MIDCFIKTHKEEGIKTFTKGFSVCLIRSVPVNAGTFLAFEAGIILKIIKSSKRFKSTQSKQTLKNLLILHV
jgi:hypothetical protein